MLFRRVDTPILALRRMILSALCALAALLVPNLAQADWLGADLDGDGIRDRIELVGGASHDLTIRFSTTRRSQRLHTNDPIVKFVVTDVDRDDHRSPCCAREKGRSRDPYLWGAIIPAVSVIAFGWWLSRELPAPSFQLPPAFAHLTRERRLAEAAKSRRADSSQQPAQTKSN